MLEAVGFAFLEVVGADFADGLEVFVEDVVDEAGLFLGGVGFAKEAFADVFDGEDATRDGGEGDEHEDRVFVLEGEVNEDADGTDEGGGFLDEAVDDVDEGDLQFQGIADDACHEVAGIILLEKGEGEGLEFFEDVEAEALEDVHPGVRHIVGVEEGAEGAEGEDAGDYSKGCQEGETGRGIFTGDFRDDVFDDEGQAGTRGGGGEDAREESNRELQTHGLEVGEVGSEAF